MHGSEGVLLFLIPALIKEKLLPGPDFFLPHKRFSATQEQENETTTSSTLFTSMDPMGEAASDLHCSKALGGMVSNYWSAGLYYSCVN